MKHLSVLTRCGLIALGATLGLASPAFADTIIGRGGVQLLLVASHGDRDHDRGRDRDHDQISRAEAKAKAEGKDLGDGPGSYVTREFAFQMSPAHVRWCEGRYRSYRAWDNSFQPAIGPRMQCVAPST